MLVGIGQGRFARCPLQSQVLQFPHRCAQSATNLTQRLGPPQVAEQHGDELAPALESTGMAIRLVLFDGRFEFQPGKQLQKLRKNTAYSIHGGSLRSLRLVRSEPNLKVTELSPFFSKPNWDTPGARPTLPRPMNKRSHTPVEGG